MTSLFRSLIRDALDLESLSLAIAEEAAARIDYADLAERIVDTYEDDIMQVMVDAAAEHYDLLPF